MPLAATLEPAAIVAFPQESDTHKPAGLATDTLPTHAGEAIGMLCIGTVPGWECKAPAGDFPPVHSSATESVRRRRRAGASYTPGTARARIASSRRNVAARVPYR